MRAAIEIADAEGLAAVSLRRVAAALDAGPMRLYGYVSAKDELLELYLNRIYFGAGAYGVDAASEVYFGKPASKLNLAEAALLASLPKAPSKLALGNDLGAARARSHLVLDAMRQEGWITAAQAQQAALTPLSLAPERPWVISRAFAAARSST